MLPLQHSPPFLASKNSKTLGLKGSKNSPSQIIIVMQHQNQSSRKNPLQKKSSHVGGATFGDLTPRQAAKTQHLWRRGHDRPDRCRWSAFPGVWFYPNKKRGKNLSKSRHLEKHWRIRTISFRGTGWPVFRGCFKLMDTERRNGSYPGNSQWTFLGGMFVGGCFSGCWSRTNENVGLWRSHGMNRSGCLSGGEERGTHN